MRCARCDRIAIPQVLARAPDGRLVFGWCPACLEEEGCTVVDCGAVPLKLADRAPFSRRVRKVIRRVRRELRKPRSAFTTRRMAVIGVAGIMAIWALILAFVGGVKLVGPNDGKGPWLLFGAGLMALTSLAAWVTVIGRSGGVAMVLKIFQVAASVMAFGTLLWGLSRPTKTNTAYIVGIAGTSLAVAWAFAKIGAVHRRSMKLARSERGGSRLGGPR